MQISSTFARVRPFITSRFHPAAIALVMAIANVVCGCGSGSPSSSNPAPPPSTNPTPQNANVSGQYTLLLTSTNGHGATSVYTNFTQSGATVAGTAYTLVCPSNDLAQCKGSDAPAISITPAGTVKGTSVTITISYPNSAGVDTVAMVGEASRIYLPSLMGTYTDSLNDTGSWTAFPSGTVGADYSGTFNSTSNPLSISPTILMSITQDASLNLTGTATILNLPCINSLNLSGQAIGGAFRLADVTNKVAIVVVPNGSNFAFNYNFDSTAPSCPGDSGRGLITNQDPWGY
jgi:hypothetical protein